MSFIERIFLFIRSVLYWEFYCISFNIHVRNGGCAPFVYIAKAQVKFDNWKHLRDVV